MCWWRSCISLWLGSSVDLWAEGVFGWVCIWTAFVYSITEAHQCRPIVLSPIMAAKEIKRYVSRGRPICGRGYGLNA